MTMLLVRSWSFGCSHLLLQPMNQSNNIHCEAATHQHQHLCFIRSSSRKRNLVPSTLACLRVVTDSISEIAHNKVLMAAAVCAAVGQLAKPFTGSILYGRGFNPMAAFQAGGFPSTHSSAAVATAMSLGLERGFSDAIFGLAVVYAGLTIYDAQGVRREVGIHAKTLNRTLFRHKWNSFEADSLGESSSGKSSSNSKSHDSLILEEKTAFMPEMHEEALFLRSDKRMKSSCLTTDVEGGSESSCNDFGPLKESIGHTEIEVLAGALLGFIVSLAIYSV